MNDYQKTEEGQFLKKLQDKISIVQKTGIVQVTDFLHPHYLALAKILLEKETACSWLFYGGIESAERQRIILGPLGHKLSFRDGQIILIRGEGNFTDKKVSHRDFLGAILATGIKREKIGDLWLHPQGCIFALEQKLA